MIKVTIEALVAEDEEEAKQLPVPGRIFIKSAIDGKRDSLINDMIVQSVLFNTLDTITERINAGSKTIKKGESFR